MKWLAALAIVVGGGVGTFAIYTFGWHESDSNDSERARAVAYAQEIVGVTRQALELSGIARVNSGLWRARFWQSGRFTCLQIHLDRFAVQSASETRGVSRVTCRGVAYDPVSVDEP